MRFSEIIGQDLAVRLLERTITSDAISHAYLFAGVEGVGKTTTALAFASALNCQNRTSEGDSCGECWSCRAIAESRHPDVELIAPETEVTKIDQMRDMRHRAQFPPIRSPWKVIIIERADTLNEDSASAILKILEEPPSYAVLLLLTRNVSAVLPTIVSRCQTVRFQQTPAEELRQVLMERHGADEEKADLLARYSEGRPGTAISLLNDEEFFARRELILDLAQQTQTAPKAKALRLAEDFRKACAPPKAPRKAKGAKQAQAAEEPPQSEDEDEEEQETTSSKAKVGRREIRQGLDSLVLWYRDLLSLSLMGGDAHIINTDKKPQLAAAVQRVSPDHSRAILDTLTWARRAIEGNANTQLITEVVMMRIVR